MSYTKHTLPAHPANYGGPRASSAIRYLVYHYTANRTDQAVSNANYFKNNVVKASAHYFVDSGSVYQSVPDLHTAYSVGGRKYTDCAATGGGSLYGKITNANSISIEMCSVNGSIPEATLENALSLGKELMERYQIPLSRVYRHFDVNGKHCPGWDGWYGKKCPKWTAFKNRLSETVPAETPPPYTPPAPAPVPSPIYQIRPREDLNIRKSPGGRIVTPDGAKKGIRYTIEETVGTWGRLKSGAGWITVSDKYVSRV